MTDKDSVTIIECASSEIMRCLSHEERPCPINKMDKVCGDLLLALVGLPLHSHFIAHLIIVAYEAGKHAAEIDLLEDIAKESTE